MRKLHEVLRLHVQAGLSERTIAKSVSLSRSTVAKIIVRAQEAGISWPLPADMDDAQLESILFPVAQGRPKNCFEPPWNWKKRLQISTRHEHRAGEKMFVGHAGQPLSFVDRETGEVQHAHVFVAVLPIQWLDSTRRGVTSYQSLR